jgi:hypothetical protein
MAMRGLWAAHFCARLQRFAEIVPHLFTRRQKRHGRVSTSKGGLIRRLGDGAKFQVDAALEHVSDFEEGFVVGIELGAVFDLAKSGLKNRETMPGLQDVDEILGFDTAHGGTFVYMETRFRSFATSLLVTNVTRCISD